MEPIIKKRVRILRPSELKQLLSGIPKFEHQLLFKALLYSGMRYIELQRFKQHSHWFDGSFIHMVTLKEQAREKERWIRLNPRGREVISSYINSPYKLPCKVTWNENIKRWAKNCSLVSDGLSSKSTRKTWESWLSFYYPEHRIIILQSQGHTSTISLDHYLNMPFDDEQRIIMKEYVEGWI